MASVALGGTTQTVIYDGAQIELDAGDGATPYADGDQGSGYAWTGAPHFSVSVRANAPREGGY